MSLAETALDKVRRPLALSGQACPSPSAALPLVTECKHMLSTGGFPSEFADSDMSPFLLQSVLTNKFASDTAHKLDEDPGRPGDSCRLAPSTPSLRDAADAQEASGSLEKQRRQLQQDIDLPALSSLLRGPPQSAAARWALLGSFATLRS